MSHPPIPEPQPHTDGDEPRTQSILLPPSQRQTDAEDPSSAEGQQPEQAAGQPLSGPGTAQFEQPAPGQFGQPPYDPQPGYGAQPSYDPQPQWGTQPSYDPTTSQVTGPVGFVPGFPGDAAQSSGGGSTAAAPPPSSGPATAPGFPTDRPQGRRRNPLAALQGGARGAVLALVLGVVGLGLLELGLVREFGNQSLWDVVPTWSAFATVAALLVLVPAVVALTGGLPARTAWRVGAVGLAALVATWVLVALPLAASDRGFWLTAAVAAAGAALWLAPGRTE